MSLRPVLLPMIVTSLMACYGSAPPTPARVPLPPTVQGALITTQSEERTELETVEKEARICPPGKTAPSDCTVTTYSVKEPVTRVHTTMMYGDQPISIGQFNVMVDPQYEAKRQRLADLSHRCQRANIPRKVGFRLLVGALLTNVLLSSALGDATLPVALGMAGAGAASYGLGYVWFGGRDCNEAFRVFNDVDHAGETAMDVTGRQLADEIQTLASRFNANRPGTSSAMQSP